MSIQAKVLTIALAVAVCCRQENPREGSKLSPPRPTSENNIVLVNAKNASRCQISQIVKELSQCKPRIIGVDFFFGGPGPRKRCDSLLAASLRLGTDVVLADGVVDNEYVEPYAVFLANALSSAPQGLQTDIEGTLIEAVPFVTMKGRNKLAMPFQLASALEIKKMTILLSDSRTIDAATLSQSTKRFPIIDFETIDQSICDQVAGKTVIIGFLGPEPRNLIRIRRNGERDSVYGSLLLARAVAVFDSLINNPE